MYLLYSFILVFWGILLLPAFLYKAWRRNKGFPGISQRLGRLPENLQNNNPETFWFHACSVGETLSLQPLAQALHRRFPRARFIFSTTTQSGQEIAVERFARYGDGNTFYFPIDLACVVSRVLDWIKPSLITVVETEIWPNLLHQAHGRNIPVVLVNGRISNASFRHYRWGRSFLKKVFPQYRALLMQSKDDAFRIRGIGAPAEKITVTGNIKFDAGAFEEDADAVAAQDLEQGLGLNDLDAPLIVAGSTHPDEEAILFEVFKSIRTTRGLERTQLLVAPRHPERFEEVAQLAIQNGLGLKRRSQNSGTDSGAEVLLLDTIGELAAVYRYATVVFVGGTLTDHGGHSIIEPAICSKPIVVGPSMENFRSILSEFLTNGGIWQIAAGGKDRNSQVRQLLKAFRQLLQNRAERDAMGLAAREVLDRNHGAVSRSAQIIESIYEEGRRQE
jgi:3-deoxy-D-manno-octulosonic-acid transferase